MRQAYAGACLVDEQCYGGGARGMVRSLIPTTLYALTIQTWYWHRASDPGSRSRDMYPGGSEKFDNSAEQPADLVIIQMGGNDYRHPNEIPGRDFYHAYVDMIEDIHSTWPNAVVLIMVRTYPYSPPCPILAQY